jgi:hypothetical protein
MSDVITLNFRSLSTGILFADPNFTDETRRIRDFIIHDRVFIPFRPPAQ